MENKKVNKTKNVIKNERGEHELKLSIEKCKDNITCSDDTETIGILFPRDTDPYNK